jgi:prepilin-type N-terminal cleavage/methylation domain-containing protein
MHFSCSQGKARATDQGLTLPEVMVVIAILAVLATLLLFVKTHLRRKSQSRIQSGDDNFAVDGVPANSGAVNLSTNRSIPWTAKRHHFVGIVLLADGSVSQLSINGFTGALGQIGAETNVVVIP